MNGIRTTTAGLVFALASANCANGQAPVASGVTAAIDSAAMLTDVRNLSADSMDGRRTGTPGIEKARRYLDRAFMDAGLEPVGVSFRHPFGEGRGAPADTSGGQAGEAGGANLVGRIVGRDTSRVIVVSAHYDHLGERNGQIYNGADDNASGTAAILAIARALDGTTPEHTILFVAFDAEEGGLRGARAFVTDPPVARARIAVNLNLDMVSRSDKGELWVAGTHHYPFLRPVVEAAGDSAAVQLRLGHDLPGTGSDDWTGASDHGPFHAAGIPFLYFGVEDHADYHRPTDDFERIQPGFYVRAVETVLAALRLLDRQLSGVIPAGGG